MSAIGYTLAVAFGLAWLIVTLWALVWDRPRGRRRCPRCFYQIDAALGLKCAECGHTAPGESALLRTRRRWGMAALAALLLLLPSLAAAGLGYIGTGGWPGVPSPIATRLLWIHSDALQTEVISRIRSGRIEHDDAARIVRHAARRIDHGPEGRAAAFDLLSALARNSFVNTQDRPGTSRPMLEELHPELTVPLLLSIVERGPSQDAAKALDLLSHLRDADERANMTIIISLASDDQAIADAALQSLRRNWRPGKAVRRLPHPPGPNPRVSAVGLQEADLRAFGHEVRQLQDDRAALIAWLRDVSHAERVPGVDTLGIGGSSAYYRGMAMWLYCRLRAFDDEAWAAVSLALQDDDHGLLPMAIEQISGFPWSARVENALRQVMEQSNGENDHSVLTTAARFGPQAAALIPLFIEYASAPRRSGGSSAFVREFRAIGGDDRQLLNALVDRLEGVELPANPHSSSAPPPRRLPGSVWMDFWWLTDIGLRDERGAAAIKPFMRPGSTMPDASDPAVAYAVLSGDRTAATQFLLEFKPDFTQPLFLGSPQYTTFELLRRQLADQDLIIAHFVETDDISRRRGLATVLSTYMASHILAEYEPILQRLANDPDDATATAAKRALQKLAPK